MLEEILAYNKKFVEDKGYEAYIISILIRRLLFFPVWTLV